jgi:transposase
LESKAKQYLPAAFRSFQGFDVVDLKEWRSKRHLEIVLEKNSERRHVCGRCGASLGAMNSRYIVRAKHLSLMSWSVTVAFWREKRHCPGCEKIRSEEVEFLCPSSPHVTMELAWWLSRLTEVTSVLAVSRLESLDKKTCYAVDKFILTRLLQGYRIPKVTRISVDEVYARGPRQLKEGEDRDDLFLTIIVDLKTRKVIWVSQSRKKEALDEFFTLLGQKGCSQIEVVACDQHAGYQASVEQFCPNATIVWDRFHLVQQFNDALNEDRRAELEAMDPEGKIKEEMGDLMNGKYRYVFTTKAQNRSETDRRHIDQVTRLNHRMARLEIIKEHFHKMYDNPDEGVARVMMAEVYEWAMQAGAWNVWVWIRDTRESARFWNYWKFRVSTGLSEGINRVIKGLKWQAYGYRDMYYFALKILQKAGYLNSRYHFQKLPTP